MTYPKRRYVGAEGQISATYRPVDGSPELTYPNGNTVHYLATGATTNGQFGLYRWEMGPTPSGPDPHFHRSISESFFILSGSVRIYDGTRWIDTEPGDFVHVPEGGVHAFRNESGAPASMLLHFAPGAPREGYFEGILDLAGASEDERMEFFLRHDTFWLQS
ncbi:cupin domain-containing protein [Dactylosporangium sucinum]|uniref:Cupin n=1 Tax=Dactylosporangium sucinum TaxID=1424081 RepID=A0A917WX79_9ACTN|nr:cupin domain-containing protein [Dactylosporangium sucinum]GGM37690.1 cupin [Dactylosporangium sucinum]